MATPSSCGHSLHPSDLGSQVTSSAPGHGRVPTLLLSTACRALPCPCSSMAGLRQGLVPSTQQGTQQGLHQHLLKTESLKFPPASCHHHPFQGLPPLPPSRGPPPADPAGCRRPEHSTFTADPCQGCWHLPRAKLNIGGQRLECCPIPLLPQEAFLMPGSVPPSTWRLSLGPFLN